MAAVTTTASAGRLLGNLLPPTHRRRSKDSAQEWRAAENADADTLFCGHTHQPYVRELSGGSIRVTVEQAGSKGATEQELTLPMRRIVNAGSVGEPRHGDTKATYVIHNDTSGEVTIREVEYDVAKTCQAIVDAGLPEVFAWRLSHGFEYAERAEDASHVCER